MQKLKLQVDKGRAASRRSKLHRICSLRNREGERVTDDELICNSLGALFSNKFGSQNLHLREAFLDFARAAEGVLPGFDEMDVEKALSKCRKPLSLDGYGMCFELLRVAYEARPSEFTSWLQFIASSEAMMSSLESPLLCYGKSSKHSKLLDVRGIIPTCVLLRVLDRLLASLLSDRLVSLLPKHPEVFCRRQAFYPS